MSKLKEIQSRQPQNGFNLEKMETIYNQVNGKTDVPHRHNYYTVLLIEKAAGYHNIDYNTYPFNPLEVHFVAPGQVHQVVLDKTPSGTVLTFSKDFLIQSNIPESFISNIRLFKHFGDASPLGLDDELFSRLRRIINEMESCLPLEFKYRNRALGALLQLFLIYSNNSCSLDPAQLEEDNSRVCILRDFKKLVDSKFSEWHDVKSYASVIHISPKHLSYTTKQLTGMTAKEIIQDRILLESKRLLVHTNMIIKEIAYIIGFEEPLHFSSFFKKHTGISPTDFRNNRS